MTPAERLRKIVAEAGRDILPSAEHTACSTLNSRLARKIMDYGQAEYAEWQAASDLLERLLVAEEKRERIMVVFDDQPPRKEPDR